MKVLGLGCGQPGGSAEILLTAALREAGDAELIRLTDLTTDEHLWWLWERLVECDGLIVSTPIINRTVAARLKSVIDFLLGPNADAAIIEHLVAVRRSGTEPAVPFRVDERVLKPRVAGLIAVGGSLTPQWKTLALPLLHTTAFSMHIAVVDQVAFGGAGTPQSILLDDAALTRAAQLGSRVVSQLGLPADEVRYLGEPGLCPMCHLNVVELDGAAVTCATCGSMGELGEGARIRWTDLTSSVISMDEKRAHAREIQWTASAQAKVRADIDARAAEFGTFDHVVRP
jgi:multimeric flavodoxin WrbA